MTAVFLGGWMFTQEKLGKWSLMSDRRTPAVIWVLSELVMNKLIGVDEELVTRVGASMTLQKPFSAINDDKSICGLLGTSMLLFRLPPIYKQ